MKILFEDESIAVCIKPDGMLSQSDSTGGESAVSVLQSQIGGEIFPVHRLDRTTVGLMVFAKTSAAASALSRSIAEQRFNKHYTAVVHGCPEKNSGQMTDLLFFDRRKNKSFTVKRERAGVKRAVLDYRLVSFKDTELGKVSELDISLGTGRTHQIRVQCGSRGMPLLGDRRYGARDEYKRIALCAVRLSFPHPKTGDELSFDICDTPEYTEWRNYFD